MKEVKQEELSDEAMASVRLQAKYCAKISDILDGVHPVDIFGILESFIIGVVIQNVGRDRRLLEDVPGIMDAMKHNILEVTKDFDYESWNKKFGVTGE